MSRSASQPFDIASLDKVRAIDISPEVFENNLAALALGSPAIARLVGESAIPKHWQAAFGLDDALTFRIEQPGQPARWLADTAAPRTRAEALLDPQKLANVNVLLPSVATGAELARLMHVLSPHQAVFVADLDPQRIAAILRLNDFSQAIKCGRIYFLVGEDIGPGLISTLARIPGLLAPSLIVNLPDQSAARIEDLRVQCERASRVSAQSRATRMAEIADAAAIAEPVQTAPPRLGVLALTAEQRVWRLADQLVAAAQELGWPAESYCLNSPVRVHPLGQAEWLASFRPTQMILCDTVADKIAIKTSACINSLSHTPENCSEDAGVERHLSLSPRHNAALRTAGIAPARIVDFPWSASRVSRQEKDALTIDVLLLGDLPSLDPAHLGIEQTTHELLWSALKKVALAKWADKESSKPEALLREAERMIGFDLPDESMRGRFLRLIKRILLPTVSLIEIEKLAGQAGLRCAAVGNGWSRERSGARSFATVVEAVQAGMSPRLAIATLLPDGLGQDGIDALAHGFPLALHVPPAIRPSDFLPADISSSNCVLCAGSPDAWRILLSDLSNRAREIAQKVDASRRLVETKYSWHRVLQRLV